MLLFNCIEEEDTTILPADTINYSDFVYTYFWERQYSKRNDITVDDGYWHNLWDTNHNLDDFDGDLLLWQDGFGFYDMVFYNKDDSVGLLPNFLMPGMMTYDSSRIINTHIILFSDRYSNKILEILRADYSDSTLVVKYSSKSGAFVEIGLKKTYHITNHSK